MPLTREQKQKIIEDLKEKIAGQKAMLFFDQSDIKAEDLFGLRKSLKQREGLLKVVKKALFDLALRDKNPKLAEKIKEIQGQLAVIFCLSDEIGPAKELYRLSRENPGLKIWGGFFEQEFQPAENIIALAQLPSKEEILAQLTATLFNPVSGLVNALRGNLRNLVYVLSQI